MGKPNSQEANIGAIFRETDRTNDRKLWRQIWNEKLLRIGLILLHRFDLVGCGGLELFIFGASRSPIIYLQIAGGAPARPHFFFFSPPPAKEPAAVA
jgi:hypothetical protein